MASRLQDVIARGPAVDKPAATDVAIGTLYFSYDAGLLERSNGTSWETYAAPAASGGITQLTGDVVAGPGSGSQVATLKNNLRFKTLTIPFDGGSVTPALGTGLPVSVNFNGNIIRARAFGSSPTGSAVIELWKANYAGYPPVAAGSIVGAAPVTLSGSNKSEDSTLTGWTPAIAAGDILMGNLVSITGHTWVVVFLDVVVL